MRRSWRSDSGGAGKRRSASSDCTWAKISWLARPEACNWRWRRRTKDSTGSEKYSTTSATSRAATPGGRELARLRCSTSSSGGIRPWSPMVPGKGKVSARIRAGTFRLCRRSPAGPPPPLLPLGQDGVGLQQGLELGEDERPALADPGQDLAARLEPFVDHGQLHPVIGLLDGEGHLGAGLGRQAGDVLVAEADLPPHRLGPLGAEGVPCIGQAPG